MASRQNWPLDVGGLPDLSGCQVGRFVIKRRLGSGGMGEVYYAEDTKLKRPVALKRVAPKLGWDPRYRERLLKEAERASALSFRHIAGVFDVLEEKGEVFLVMEYVEGDTLRSRLQKPIPLNEFHEIATQCAEALVAAHEKGVLHRDIKPENIMLTRTGEVKMLDFGLAKQLPVVDEKAMTASDESRAMGDAGTSGYVAPEGLLGQELDARADIFSLGVVFYEMLTGVHPFRGSGYVVTADRVLHHEPTPIARLNTLVTAEVEDIVFRMLAKDRTERYLSPADLLADLRAAQQDSTLPQSVLAHWLRVVRIRSSRPAFRWIAAAVVLAVGLAAAFRPRPHPPPSLERQWVLIADFENSTGNEVFDHSLNAALSAYLGQSAQLKVFPEERARRALPQLGLPETAPISRKVASQIVFRERIPLVIAGTISGVGDRYVLSLQLIDPYRQDEVLSLAAEARGVEEVLPQLNELARAMRREAGESMQRLRATDRPMEKITTASLEALQNYSVGRREHLRGNFVQAVALYKEALRLDPDFALAYVRLSAVYKNLGELELSRDALQQAWRRNERVSEPEHHVISALYFMEREEYDKAIESLLALTGRHTDDPAGNYYLTICYLLTMDLESAERAGRRAVELDPSPAARNNLAVVLVTRNKFREAASVLEAAQAQDRGVADLARLLTLAYAGAGQEERALKQVEALQAGPAQAQIYGRENKILLLLHQGHWSQAESELRRFLSEGPSHTRSYEFSDRAALAHLYVLQGKTSLALEQLRRAEQQPNLSLQNQAVLAAHYAWAQQPGQVARQEQTLGHLAASTSRKRRAYADFARGARHVAQGENNAALQPLGSAVRDWDSPITRFLLAQALLHSGHWQDAVRELDQVKVRTGEALREGYPLIFLLLADYYRGRAYQGMGDAANARLAYTGFLRSLAGGATALPLAVDAKLRLKELERKTAR